MDSQLSAALQYVRDNKSWTEVDEALAIEDMIRYRSPIEYTDDDISNAISALMDEYGSSDTLTDEEVEMIDEFLDSYGFPIFIDYDEHEFFTSCPAFGLPCDCVEGKIYKA